MLVSLKRKQTVSKEKEGMDLCVFVGCSGKVESIKAKCCLVYLRLLQIKGENSRNSALGGETSGFLW